MVKQQEALKNKIVSGAWVQQVADNSPAYKAGVSIGKNPDFSIVSMRVFFT
jgi:S1-C subfamily serine protease